MYLSSVILPKSLNSARKSGTMKIRIAPPVLPLSRAAATADAAAQSLEIRK
jgi:hypothetical protein